jgi:hypothetical protein
LPSVGEKLKIYFFNWAYETQIALHTGKRTEWKSQCRSVLTIWWGFCHVRVKISKRSIKSSFMSLFKQLKQLFLSTIHYHITTSCSNAYPWNIERDAGMRVTWTMEREISKNCEHKRIRINAGFISTLSILSQTLLRLNKRHMLLHTITYFICRYFFFVCDLLGRTVENFLIRNLFFEELFLGMIFCYLFFMEIIFFVRINWGCGFSCP